MVKGVTDDGVHDVEEENRKLPFPRDIITAQTARTRGPIGLLPDVGFQIDEFRRCMHRRRHQKRPGSSSFR